MYMTGDPVADYDRYDAEWERALAQLPACCECGERVMDDHYYLINDEVICPACLERYRREIEDYDSTEGW